MSKTKNQFDLQRQQAKSWHGRTKYTGVIAFDSKYGPPQARPADALPFRK